MLALTVAHYLVKSSPSSRTMYGGWGPSESTHFRSCSFSTTWITPVSPLIEAAERHAQHHHVSVKSISLKAVHLLGIGREETRRQFELNHGSPHGVEELENPSMLAYLLDHVHFHPLTTADKIHCGAKLLLRKQDVQPQISNMLTGRKPFHQPQCGNPSKSAFLICLPPLPSLRNPKP